MPSAAPRICGYPGCLKRVNARYCTTHAVKEQKVSIQRVRSTRKYDINSERARGSAFKRGYTREWARYRAAYLTLHPLCECDACSKSKRRKLAEEVDHIIPHKGDKNLFWDPKNHRAMNKRCHSRKTALYDSGLLKKRGPTQMDRVRLSHSGKGG